MNNIERYRKNRNLTQQQLADKIGVSQANVSMWEKGKAFPQANKLPVLAKVLGCNIDKLFSYENQTIERNV